MNIDIRKSIISNFKDSNPEDITISIKSAIDDQDEVTLPGLGVFFEILWNHSSEQEKKTIVDIIYKNLQ